MSNSFSICFCYLLFPFDFIDELFRSCVAGVPDVCQSCARHVLDGTPAT